MPLDQFHKMLFLPSYIGKSIGQICDIGFTSPNRNHCAHFVCHVLDIGVGAPCGNMVWRKRGQGATMRVNDLYNNLDDTGPWEDRPPAPLGYFIFVIGARYMNNNVMRSVRQKHVGIVFGEYVYHYSNTGNRVVIDSSVKVFHDRFKRVYAGDDISLYYGSLPEGPL